MGTQSNALEKSSSMASICCLSFSPLVRSSIVRMSCVSHDSAYEIRVSSMGGALGVWLCLRSGSSHTSSWVKTELNWTPMMLALLTL